MKKLSPNFFGDSAPDGAASVMVLFGTRPEAIKLAPVIEALQRHPSLSPVVVDSGQHRELVDQVLSDFSITADHDLAIGRAGQTLAGTMTRTLRGLESLLRARRPSAIVVEGDTTTTLAGAMAAFYERIPVAHVEAGLRTGRHDSPFPEEAHRRCVTVLSSLHLTPTRQSSANLLAEGVDPESVICTGNSVIDSLHYALGRVASSPGPNGKSIVDQFAVDGRRLVLMTVHRRESWGIQMAGIGRAVAAVAKSDPSILFVVPLHPNPVVRDVLLAAFSEAPNVKVIEPLPYVSFIKLLQLVSLVLTDSGGIQEEASSLGKPVLVLRDATDRPETVSAGTAQLIGTGPEAIVAATRSLLDDPLAYRRMAQPVNVYGDGHAGARIVDALSWALKGTPRPVEFDPDSAHLPQ